MGIVESSYYVSNTPEVRNDFFVSEKRKKIWNIQLGLLKEFECVCEKYKLTYFVTNGTLLGAIRHNGFVPWDDDFDVCMPRPDYEKLTEVANFEFKKPVYLHTEFTESNTYRPWMRLRNENTTAVPTKDWNRDIRQGIFIDVFPIDGISRNKFSVFFNDLHIRFLTILADNNVYYDYYTNHKLIRLFAKKYTNRLIRKGKYDLLLKKIRRTTAQYDYSNAKIVCIKTHGKRFVYPKSFFKPLIHDFENTKVTIPSGYENILRMIYGDYEKLPPQELRGQRHSIFFDPDSAYEKYYGKVAFAEVEKELNNY
ncbi:MAG: LicD family protein [Treponema sp.]|nr:LicD family protein [Treponema sp.]